MSYDTIDVFLMIHLSVKIGILYINELGNYIKGCVCIKTYVKYLNIHVITNIASNSTVLQLSLCI